MINIHVFPGLEEPDRLLRQAAKLTEIRDVVVAISVMSKGLVAKSLGN